MFDIERLERRTLLAADFHITARGTLVIRGTDEADFVSVRKEGNKLAVSLDHAQRVRAGFTFAEVKRLLIEGGGGNDNLSVATSDRPVTLAGGAGHDQLHAGRNATLIGGAGNDNLNAGGISVITFRDGQIIGQDVTDTRPSLLSGGLGNDTLHPGGPDTVVGGAGSDLITVQFTDPLPIGSSVSAEELLEDELGLEMSGIENVQFSPRSTTPSVIREIDGKWLVTYTYFDGRTLINIISTPPPGQGPA